MLPKNPVFSSISFKESYIEPACCNRLSTSISSEPIFSIRAVICSFSLSSRTISNLLHAFEMTSCIFALSCSPPSTTFCLTYAINSSVCTSSPRLSFSSPVTTISFIAASRLSVSTSAFSISAYAFIAPISAAVPDNGNGPATMTSASSRPAVARAFLYMPTVQ